MPLSGCCCCSRDIVATLPFGQSANAWRIAGPSGPGTVRGTGGFPGCACSLGGSFRVSSVIPTTAPAAAIATAATVNASWTRWDTSFSTLAGIPSGATIVFEGMASYRELLQQTKAEVEEVDARRHDEWDEGYIPGAIHIPRGSLESRIESRVPDRTAPVVLYCATGERSAFAAKSLAELGYERPVSLVGGIVDWKRNGYEIEVPKTLSPERRARYSRHLLIPEIGEEGQLKLLDAKILLLGAGGLGSPAALYLAAAGVGHIGIVDAD